MLTVRLNVTPVAVIGLGMLLGASTYESVVMAPNYAAQVPESLERIRRFFVNTNPATLFRVLAPVAQLLLALAVLQNWRVQGARWWLVAAFVALALADVVTFAFHYPRNELLFARPLNEVPAAQLEEAARQWGRGNHVRVGLIAAATVSTLRGLSRSWRMSNRGDR